MDNKFHGVPSSSTIAQRLLAEGAMPLRRAAEKAGLLPPPSTKTLLRWTIAGIRGVRLERVRAGGRVLTSVPAVHRFVAATQVDQRKLNPAEDAINHESALVLLRNLGLVGGAASSAQEGVGDVQ